MACQNSACASAISSLTRTPAQPQLLLISKEFDVAVLCLRSSGLHSMSTGQLLAKPSRVCLVLPCTSDKRGSFSMYIISKLNLTGTEGMNREHFACTECLNAKGLCLR